MARILVTGGTGYLGRSLIPELLARGHAVRALAARPSLGRVPAGAEPIPGDALSPADVAAALEPGATLVQLVGTPHPSPRKAAEFQAVDLASARAAAEACARVGPAHAVYVSVARPAPVMRAYQAAREEGERAFLSTGVPLTILRPWYVLGPGHRWAYALLPMYAVLERIPSTRERALRLGLVTLPQMVRALVQAVERPPDATRTVDVVGIRNAGG